LRASQRLPTGVTATRTQKDDFTLDIQDVPAFIYEANAPPENGLRYAVHFYWAPYISGDLFWQNEIQRWSKQLNLKTAVESQKSSETIDW
jgi:hypothetical protein